MKKSLLITGIATVLAIIILCWKIYFYQRQCGELNINNVQLATTIKQYEQLKQYADLQIFDHNTPIYLDYQAKKFNVRTIFTKVTDNQKIKTIEKKFVIESRSRIVIQRVLENFKANITKIKLEKKNMIWFLMIDCVFVGRINRD